MSNIISAWPNFGCDLQGTQRSSNSIDIDNIQDLYYSIPFSEVIVNGSAACVPIGVYNGEEYAYLGTQLNGVGVAKHYALKTNLSGAPHNYEIAWAQTLVPSQNGDIALRTAIGTFPSGQTGMVVSGALYTSDPSLQNIWQLSPDGVVTPFTGTHFKYNGGDTTYLFYYLAYCSPYFFRNDCYTGDGLVFKFDADHPSNDYIWKQTDSYSGAKSNWLIFNPDKIGGDYYRIYYIGEGNTWGYMATLKSEGVDAGQVEITATDFRFGPFPDHWRPRGVCYSSDTDMLYATICNVSGGASNETYGGVVAIDHTLTRVSQIIDTSYPVWGGPALASDGTIYFRAGPNLYACSDDGLGNLSIKHSTSVLPYSGASDHNTAAPVIDGSGRIIVCSNLSTSVNNVHIFTDMGTYFRLDKSFRVGGSGRLLTPPSIGSTGLLYILSTTSASVLYVYGSNTPTTTTTTTTSPVTTTTTTGTGTTTTTTTLAATTTTTTLPPLAMVKTIQFESVDDRFVVIQTSNASDDSSTRNSLISQSLSFGTIAPDEISKTIIIQFNVPLTRGITNIRLGLTATDGISFTNDAFGITTSAELRDDITPETYFQGVNSTASSTSPNNISIPNKDNHTSQYVYLNVKLPKDQIIGEGIIKYKWWFDYA